MKKLLPVVAAAFALTSLCACDNQPSNNNTSTDTTVAITPPTLTTPPAAMDSVAKSEPLANTEAASEQTGVPADTRHEKKAAAQNTSKVTTVSAATIHSSTTKTNRNNPETDRNPLTNNAKYRVQHKPKYEYNAHDSVDSRFGLAPAK
ncbi:MAG: hypothetical protein ABI378_14160 [Chitinophagaceae bacterium]